jgi:hypothetical protein
MSTNFYLQKGACSHCGHTPEATHLGLSSGGWCFGLHVYPECGIHDLADVVRWLKDKLGYLKQPAQDWPKIVDENGQVHTLGSFLETVTKRESVRRIKEGWDGEWWGSWYQSEQHFHDTNHSLRGPSGLLRHRVDGVRILGHGAGTWDLVVGEFE